MSKPITHTLFWRFYPPTEPLWNNNAAATAVTCRRQLSQQSQAWSQPQNYKWLSWQSKHWACVWLKNPVRGLPALTGHHNRGSTHCSWKYSPNEDFSKYFLKKSNIGNWMISFYMFLPTCRLLFSMPRWLKKDPRVENANQGALGFPVVLAMLADQTAFNLGHDFAPGLKEMSNFSPSTLPSHQLDPC